MKLPKMMAVRMKLHRPISEKMETGTVTAVRSYPENILPVFYFTENQTAEKDRRKKFYWDRFCDAGMCVFSTGKRAEYPMFYRNTEKKLTMGTEKVIQMSERQSEL